MRLRTTLAAAIGAAAMVLTLPTSANAATGTFSYVYSHGGHWAVGRLHNPHSHRCITLPGAGNVHRPPAHSPRNRTNAWATVYKGTHCNGAHFRLRPHGGHGSSRLTLRSVRFS